MLWSSSDVVADAKESESARAVRELGELEDRLLQWHVANIEYSTAADVNDLSLRHWDQDDKTAFEGSHCVIREGFGAVVEWLANKVGP